MEPVIVWRPVTAVGGVFIGLWRYQSFINPTHPVDPRAGCGKRNHQVMTAFIRLGGALLGTFVGFFLGITILERFGSSIDLANRPAVLVAIVVAALLFGYLAIPYATVYPTRWAVGRLAESEASTFSLGVTGIEIGRAHV